MGRALQIELFFCFPFWRDGADRGVSAVTSLEAHRKFDETLCMSTPRDTVCKAGVARTSPTREKERKESQANPSIVPQAQGHIKLVSLVKGPYKRQPHRGVRQ